MSKWHLVEDTCSFLLPRVINHPCIPPCLCSDSFYICLSRPGWQIPHSLRSDMVSLSAHSIVSHNMVYLTSTHELRLNGLIPISIFILLEYHQDCLGRLCCLFWNAGVLFRSDISPVPTSSSLSLSRLSQFLQLSQLTGAIFQFSPSGKHTEQLNNFSIYMHGG